MKIRFLLPVLYLLINFNIHSSEIPATSVDKRLREEARAQAEEMTRAFQDYDWETLIDYTYPPLVDKSGGREAMLESLKTQAESGMYDDYRLLEADFFAYKKVYPVNNELHTLIERHSTWQTPEEKMNMRSHILAVSRDGGRHWTFLEINSLSDTNIQKLFPAFHKEVKENFYSFEEETEEK